MPKVGRPTELTPTVIEDVRRILPTVLYLETVADYIGVTRVSVRSWIKRGRAEQRRLQRDASAEPLESEALYLEFLNTYKKALAEGEVYDAGVIKKASADQWQAAAWRLERRHPNHWGRKDKMEVTGDALDKAIACELARVSGKVEAGNAQAPEGNADPCVSAPALGAAAGTADGGLPQ